MNEEFPSYFQTVPKSTVRIMLRRERRRVRFDAAIAIILTLAMGYLYAQLAVKIGIERPWIGIIAVAVQALTFMFAMWMKPSDIFLKRTPL